MYTYIENIIFRASFAKKIGAHLPRKFGVMADDSQTHFLYRKLSFIHHNITTDFNLNRIHVNTCDVEFLFKRNVNAINSI